MLVQSEALILQTTKYGESSLIVKAFTRYRGVLSFIVNGVRTSSKKNKSALLRPLTYIHFSANVNESKNLHRFKELERSVVYTTLPFDAVKSSVALLLLEMLARSIKESEPHEALFLYMKEQFIRLDQAIFDPYFHLYTLIQMTSFLGFEPHGTYTPATPYFNLLEGAFLPEKYHSAHNLDAEYAILWSDLIQGKLNHVHREKRKQLTHQLIEYYKLHLEGFGKVKSLAVLEAVLHG